LLGTPPPYQEDDLLTTSTKGFKGEIITADRDEVWEAVNTSRCDLLESMEDDKSKERMERIKKACIRTSMPTGSPQKNVNDGPPTYLELEWVYGYNNRYRGNLDYLKSPDDTEKEGRTRFVYPAACIAVVYHKFRETQTFYKSHTDDIMSLSVHPGGIYVATGQRGNKAPVHVWNSENLETEAVLSLHTRGVNLLAWGEDGSRLVSVGVDDSHIVALWDWRVNKMVASGIGGEGVLLGVAISEDGKTIVAVGVKQILFFTVDGRALRSKKGLIGSNSGGIRQAFCSCSYLNNDAYVGCASGEIYRFNNRRLVAVYQAHGVSEPVNSLERCKVSGGLISGGEVRMGESISHF
jgi:WD40 repeat protein